MRQVLSVMMRMQELNRKIINVLEASVAMRSNISLTKLFKIAIALFEIPVSGWTCLRTKEKSISFALKPND